MFDPTTSSASVSKKLPKTVIMMIEKGNLVMAIKTLAEDQNISMETAKTRIDAYETAMKAKQQQTLTAIASKQGIPNQAMGVDRAQNGVEPLSKDRIKSTPSEQNFDNLQAGLESQLSDLGYKKPLLPYWVKRLLILMVVMVGLFWILWRVFG